MSQRPRDKAPMRDGQNRPQKRPVPGGRRTEVYVPPSADPFPYIMGGVIGALVVGLMLVIILLTNRNGSTVDNPPIVGGNPTQAVISGTVPPAEGEAPRITMDEFKKLYDSANKPLIIDVRPKGGFDAGHIRGAVSFPEAEVDARYLQSSASGERDRTPDMAGVKASLGPHVDYQGAY